MKKVLLSVVVCASLLYANDAELVSYTAQKHRAEYDKQDDKVKAQIKEEYEKIQKIAKKIGSEVENEPDYKVIQNLAKIDLWTRKYVSTLKFSDEELKEIYKQADPKTVEKYKLNNILVKDEQSADKIVKQIQEIKENGKKLAKVQEIASKESLDFISNKKNGSLGWVEITKLEKSIQDAIKTKKANDVFKVNVPNIGWQVLYIEEFTGITQVPFENAKEVLTQIARQQAVMKKIDELLK